MGMFDNLPPQQRQLLMIGVPVVSVLALSSVLKGRSEPPPESDQPGLGTPALPVPSTAVVGSGELASWFDATTDALSDLAEVIKAGETKPSTPSTTPTKSQPSTVAVKNAWGTNRGQSLQEVAAMLNSWGYVFTRDRRYPKGQPYTGNLIKYANPDLLAANFPVDRPLPIGRVLSI
jgi:hypothetical protein